MNLDWDDSSKISWVSSWVTAIKIINMGIYVSTRVFFLLGSNDKFRSKFITEGAKKHRILSKVYVKWLAKMCVCECFANETDKPISNRIHTGARKITMIWWVMPFEKTSLTSKDLINYLIYKILESLWLQSSKWNIRRYVHRMMKDKQNCRWRRQRRQAEKNIRLVTQRSE